MPAAAQSRHSTFSDPAVLRAIAELDVLLDGRWLVRQEKDGGVQAVGGIFSRRHPHIGLGNVAVLGRGLASVTAEGAELIDAEPRAGLFGLEVAFVHPDSVHGVLAEVVSRA